MQKNRFWLPRDRDSLLITETVLPYLSSFVKRKLTKHSHCKGLQNYGRDFSSGNFTFLCFVTSLLKAASKYKWKDYLFPIRYNCFRPTHGIIENSFKAWIWGTPFYTGFISFVYGLLNTHEWVWVPSHITLLGNPCNFSLVMNLLIIITNTG
jgi:hypothetical protein